jgi:catechol 2,3-dioxygenase-like lactoylglutathione lyase family enzyme/protein-S-isoprenylcysteine O-methyltransferase Ste14
MAKELRATKWWVRTLDLAVWLALMEAMLLYAYSFETPPTFKTWVMITNRQNNTTAPAVLSLPELVFIAAPVLTFLFTLTAHIVDKKLAGGGMAQRAVELKHLHDLKPDIVTGTMTKLSVLVALAAIFIIIVQQDPALTGYTAFVRWIASVGFLISIFLMLISVKTYDYANRFNWEEHPTRGGAQWSYYRIQLASKAFALDISAFYFLLFTAILATGLVERWLPIPASLLCGFALWVTYFFFRKDPPLGVASLKPHSVTLSVSDSGAAATWYKEKLGFAVNERTKLLEKNGFTVQLKQADGSTPKGVAEVSFVVDDVEALAAALKAQGATVGEVRKDAALAVKEVVVKDQDETPLRFIQKLK